jgi:hypothetical protein
VWLVAALPVLAGCGGGNASDAQLQDPPAISAGLHGELEDWLSQNGKPPTEYVLGAFDNHDVVILGEQHRILHDVLFVQSMLAPMHAAGVRVFATEFGRRADQALIDSLVTSAEWDEDLGREILFRQFMPWGYREYLDILKAAWRVNRDRPEGTPPLRVLGLNNALDYSHFKQESDWDDPEIWKLVTGDQTEADWAEPVLEAVRARDKVLIHCGIHHGFTGYRQPRVIDGEFVEWGRVRLGNHLRDALGERAITIFLHAPWNTRAGYNEVHVHPAGGRLDAFMLAREDGPYTVGFDVAGSPLASLPIENAVYARGYAPFTISDFCDGWIYTKPISEYEPVGYIDGWINESNVERARAVAMNPRWRTHSVEQLNRGCESYKQDFETFFGKLR